MILKMLKIYQEPIRGKQEGNKRYLRFLLIKFRGMMHILQISRKKKVYLTAYNLSSESGREKSLIIQKYKCVC